MPPVVWLGMSIARQVAELHGGRLEIGSVESVGTSVRVFLPVAAAG